MRPLKPQCAGTCFIDSVPQEGISNVLKRFLDCTENVYFSNGMTKKYMKSFMKVTLPSRSACKTPSEAFKEGVPEAVQIATEALLGCIEIVDEMLDDIVEEMLAEGNLMCRKDLHIRWFPN